VRLVPIRTGEVPGELDQREDAAHRDEDHGGRRFRAGQFMQVVVN
jgi:hypothetical protein